MSWTKTLALLALTAGLLAGGAPWAVCASGESSAQDPQWDYAAFSLLTERNIFDPDRSPARPSRPEAEREEAPPFIPEESFDLLGALITPDWSVAIFHGSSGEYNRKCRIGESIAGMEITSIETHSVTLVGDGGTITTLPVGFRMQRRGDEPWSVGGHSPGPSERTPVEEPQGASEPGAGPTETPPPAASPQGGEAEDILKKMMERRQQEINK